MVTRNQTFLLNNAWKGFSLNNVCSTSNHGVNAFSQMSKTYMNPSCLARIYAYNARIYAYNARIYAYRQKSIRGNRFMPITPIAAKARSALTEENASFSPPGDFREWISGFCWETFWSEPRSFPKIWPSRICSLLMRSKNDEIRSNNNYQME